MIQEESKENKFGLTYFNKATFIQHSDLKTLEIKYHKSKKYEKFEKQIRF